MFSTLEKFDNITAAGILARAAFALEGGEEHNPAVNFSFPEEKEIRRKIVHEARKALGILENDDSPGTLERVGDFLDQESDALLEPIDEAATLGNLSTQGHLPSDLFNVVVIKDLALVYGDDFNEELDLIEATVRNPGMEQNLEPSEDAESPFMISLFAKDFKSKFSAKNFTLVVAGQRLGLDLIVHQAWHVYPHLINTDGANTPIELLKRFAEKFGIEITSGKTKAKFIYSTEIPPNSAIESFVRVEGVKSKDGSTITRPSFVISQFTQPKRAGFETQAALVFAINIDKYNKARSSLK